MTRENNPFRGKHGPLLIAEIGGNHEGNFDYAKKLTELAIKTDVDYVKFQIYTGDNLVSSKESPIRNKHFKKFELSQDQHRELAEMVKSAGILYTSSVWDIGSMGWIDEFITLYKIGSGDLTAYPILRETALRGKPIILSTGLSYEKEVLHAIKFIQKVNPVYKNRNMLAILQCTSMYPINPGDVNLAVIKKLKEISGLTVGYSDHTEGSKALKYAFALGAEVLEFHFTDSREKKEFRDHKVSLLPEEVKDLIKEIKLIKKIQGNPNKKPTKIEKENGHLQSFRRAIYPSKDIKVGELFSTDNLTVLRPAHGIDARYFDEIIGKTAKRNLMYHEKIEWSDIDN